MPENIIELIKSEVKPGTVIPKPDAKADFIVKSWGKRRGEEALIYSIPNHTNPSKPHQKGINASEWKKAYLQLTTGEEFDKDWFERNLPGCAEEGDCNFTTIGGIFALLGLSEYERGIYRLRKR